MWKGRAKCLAKNIKMQLLIRDHHTWNTETQQQKFNKCNKITMMTSKSLEQTSKVTGTEKMPTWQYSIGKQHILLSLWQDNV